MALCLIIACGLLHAQTRARPQFEVASVKPADPHSSMQHGPIYGGPRTASPGQIAYTNLTLKYLVLVAYDVSQYQLSEPAWMDEDHFDIVAKVPAGSTKEDVPLMLQSLLEERFQLKVRHELRETQAYVLTVGKNGPKMKAYPMQLPENFVEGQPLKFTGIDKDGFLITPPGSVAGVVSSSNGLTRMLSVRLPIMNLCSILSSRLQRPIVDQTGLAGRYDFHLVFATEGSAAVISSGDGDLNNSPPQASDPAPTLMNALQNQLGLKLEQKRLPVNFLVVEHAEKIPTEN